MGTLISFKRPDDQDASGYLALAAKGDAPGVVVIQEWWGVQDQVKAVCERFARAGFSALAPDLYRGTVVPYHDSRRASEQMESLDFIDATTQTVRGAVEFLGKSGAKVGIVGYCMGGAVVVIAGAKVPGLSAGVAYYGLPPSEAAKAAEVKIPLQGHFADKDDWCSPDKVDAFETEMTAAGKDFEVFRYDASHAFANEQRASVHDRAAAEQAWGRTTAFFDTHLR
jgi:carboxymethylenebutenolidase